MTTYNLQLKYGSYDAAVLRQGRYLNGRLALWFETEHGEKILTATTNLVEHSLGLDEVFIKVWSENEGLLQQLLLRKIVSPALDWRTSGFVVVPRCVFLLLIEA